MAKNDKKTAEKPLDIKTARKTIFQEDELRRKKARLENSHCPYRTKRVWDAEKQKYVKIKIYRKKTTFTKAEMKERFKACGRNIVMTTKVDPVALQKAVKKPIMHAKSVNAETKVTHHYIGIATRRRLDWDQNALCYKNAA